VLEHPQSAAIFAQAIFQVFIFPLLFGSMAFSMKATKASKALKAVKVKTMKAMQVYTKTWRSTHTGRYYKWRIASIKVADDIVTEKWAGNVDETPTHGQLQVAHPRPNFAPLGLGGGMLLPSFLVK
jgi:hypothetical protein